MEGRRGEGQGRTETRTSSTWFTIPVVDRQCAPRKYLLRCGLSDARVWDERSYLVPGRVECRTCLGIRRPFPVSDRAMAQGMGSGRFPVLLGAAGRLHGGETGTWRERLG